MNEVHNQDVPDNLPTSKARGGNTRAAVAYALNTTFQNI